MSHDAVKTNVSALVGSGDKIGVFTLPFLIGGVLLNVLYPSMFEVGGPPPALRVISLIVLAAGLTVWAWSAFLILKKVPRGELITNGPCRSRMKSSLAVVV